ncbi:hypothetical protein [Allocoleopsis franciscana]|uniref:Uncharacterized protein n=1 Tax=Allocoleopsis franciscana PCC 7113 TaxID=1173027 RepID=K9WE03_9CYAN|nr:hypothetical protein [Allocoleopsis franciscana]AFZ17994.1 hypothetical protein Mic7113_2179 [Allocoleopsis franciscana PCC 7113]
MKKTRPSNVILRAFGAIFLSLVLFAIGAIINHILKQARGSNEGLGEPEQELVN